MFSSTTTLPGPSSPSALDVLRRDAACLGLDASHHEARVDRRSAPLVDQHVRVLLGQQHRARLRVRAQRGLVRHRRGREEQRRLVPEDLGQSRAAAR